MNHSKVRHVPTVLKWLLSGAVGGLNRPSAGEERIILDDRHPGGFHLQKVTSVKGGHQVHDQWQDNMDGSGSLESYTVLAQDLRTLRLNVRGPGGPMSNLGVMTVRHWQWIVDNGYGSDCHVFEEVKEKRDARVPLTILREIFPMLKRAGI